VVRNPWDATRSTGGSSSGSAYLVSTGQVDFALGTDQAGSIRIPAAWCGCLGLKPTTGSIRYDGAMPVHPRLDTIGILAADLDVLRQVFAVLASPPQRHRPPRSVALVSSALSGPFSDPRVAEAVRDLGGRLQQQGLDVTLRGPSNPGLVDPLTDPMVDALELVGLGALLSPSAPAPDQPPQRHLHHHVAVDGLPFTSSWTALTNALAAVWGRECGASTWESRSLTFADALRRSYDTALLDVDALVLPTVPFLAPRLPPSQPDPWQDVTAATGASRHTQATNLTGHPALAVPWTTVDGLPSSVMLVGRHGAEGVLFDLAAIVQILRAR
jgi:amidase